MLRRPGRCFKLKGEEEIKEARLNIYLLARNSGQREHMCNVPEHLGCQAASTSNPLQARSCLKIPEDAAPLRQALKD